MTTTMPYRRAAPPNVIKARYAGTCAKTGAAIQPGATILYADGKVYCADSKTFQDWQTAEFDRTVLGREY